MTDKEVKRLTRSQLIEIIYHLQLKQDELIAENEKLSKALEDRRILLDKAGNIAQAALDIHNVMQSAQDAAAHYLEEMQIRAMEQHEQIINDAKEQADQIISQAKQQTSQIPAQTNQPITGAGVCSDHIEKNKIIYKANRTWNENNERK